MLALFLTLDWNSLTSHWLSVIPGPKPESNQHLWMTLSQMCDASCCHEKTLCLEQKVLSEKEWHWLDLLPSCLGSSSHTGLRLFACPKEALDELPIHHPTIYNSRLLYVRVLYYSSVIWKKAKVTQTRQVCPPPYCARKLTMSVCLFLSCCEFLLMKR